jgi:hypothetical protein
LVTLAERYGVPQDELVTDVMWLRNAGRNGEAVFIKDERIRYNEAEKAAVKEHAVRCFCLSAKNLNASEMAQRFMKNLPSITAECRNEGPFVAIVYADRIRHVDLG